MCEFCELQDLVTLTSENFSLPVWIKQYDQKKKAKEAFKQGSVFRDILTVTERHHAKAYLTTVALFSFTS